MEPRSFTDRAFNTNLAVHQCDQLLRDRQPKACNAVLPGRPTISLSKLFKDGSQLVMRDPTQ